MEDSQEQEKEEQVWTMKKTFTDHSIDDHGGPLYLVYSKDQNKTNIKYLVIKKGHIKTHTYFRHL